MYVICRPRFVTGKCSIWSLLTLVVKKRFSLFCKLTDKISKLIKIFSFVKLNYVPLNINILNGDKTLLADTVSFGAVIRLRGD